MKTYLAAVLLIAFLSDKSAGADPAESPAAPAATASVESSPARAPAKLLYKPPSGAGNIPKVVDGRESPKPATPYGFCNGFFQKRLDDWTFRFVDAIDFVHIEVDASDVMSVLSQAGGNDGADITQTKYSNFHE
jgi:hypothetical protein